MIRHSSLFYLRKTIPSSFRLDSSPLHSIWIPRMGMSRGADGAARDDGTSPVEHGSAATVPPPDHRLVLLDEMRNVITVATKKVRLGQRRVQ